MVTMVYPVGNEAEIVAGHTMPSFPDKASNRTVIS